MLDQFGHPVDGDSQARPLLITEGSSQHKLQAIEGNDYLAHALDQLGECGLPLVVFGSASVSRISISSRPSTAIQAGP